VAKEGTVTASPGELIAHFAGQLKRTPNRSVLEMCLAYERKQGRSIVFTNGCFDIIHAGHTSYLSRAKSLGDVLVVGVNSDAGVRRLKGARRPINRLENRMEVLSALSCVDYLVEFDEDTPAELIRQIRPEIFVKGGDYSRQDLPEAVVVEECGGRVEILPYLEAQSTTRIIERIRREARVGAR
jgi:D-beta-D-heptose 7-phosphate kinase/D-beta-D-heptose 1-phosphate adenosyltransferase